MFFFDNENRNEYDYFNRSQNKTYSQETLKQMVLNSFESMITSSCTARRTRDVQQWMANDQRRCPTPRKFRRNATRLVSDCVPDFTFLLSGFWIWRFGNKMKDSAWYRRGGEGGAVFIHSDVCTVSLIETYYVAPAPS